MIDYCDMNLLGKLSHRWYDQEKNEIILNINQTDLHKIIDGKYLSFGFSVLYGGILGICHEMSHLIEIDDLRILSPNWGLGYKKENDKIKSYQDIERECRVAAIQIYIEKTIGIERSIQERISNFTKLKGI